ncbi:MAG: response regulator [Pricia sp.]
MKNEPLKRTKIQKVCIIDDDPIFVYGTKRIMDEVDFCDEVIVYHDGQEALDGLNEMNQRGEELPSIIFVDLNMPVMNGWEFLEDFIKIDNHNRDKVIVYIISSSVDPRDLEQIRNYPVVNQYILKPITPEALENVLRDVE